MKQLDEILHLVSPEEVMELLLTVCTQSTEAETIVWAAVEQVNKLYITII